MTHAGARWRATWGLTAALWTLGALTLGSTAQANLPVEDSYPVRTVVSVDLGDHGASGWSFFTTSRHLVRPAPAKANADAKATAADDVAVEASEVYMFFGSGGIHGSWHMFDARHDLAPYTSKADFRDNASGLHLVAIRTKELPAFWKRVDAVKPEKDKDGTVIEHTKTRAYRADTVVQELARTGAPWFAFSKQRLGGRVREKDHDPVRTIRLGYVLTGVTGGYLALRAEPRRFFDAKGKELTRMQVASAKRERSVVLFVLSGVGLLGLALLIVRRARAAKRSDPDLVSVA